MIKKNTARIDTDSHDDNSSVKKALRRNLPVNLDLYQNNIFFYNGTAQRKKEGVTPLQNGTFQN